MCIRDSSYHPYLCSAYEIGMLGIALFPLLFEMCIRDSPERLRPVDIPLIEADIQKLVRDTGWHPVVPLEQTLQDTLSYWRSAVKNA